MLQRERERQTDGRSCQSIKQLLHLSFSQGVTYIHACFTERDRKTETDRHRRTDRQTETETETDTEIETQREAETERKDTYPQTDKMFEQCV